VLLADQVEAASKTLLDPTPARIQGAVQKIINNIFADGQLDECELTLKDLHEIAKKLYQDLERHLSPPGRVSPASRKREKENH